jgi:dihydrofolate reductase
MIFSIIAAVSQNGVIGNNGKLPWRLPNDLKYFKQKTLYHTVIMGRLTFESIGKALPHRRNIVLTSQKNYYAPNCEMAHNLEELYSIISKEEKEIFILGGAQIFASFLALPQTQNLYISHVLAEVEGDIFFPKVNWEKWKMVKEIFYPKDAKNSYAILIKEYNKI